jgi:hypothetical protein
MRFAYLASCVAAFLFAALAPAFVLAGLGRSIQLAPIAFFIALGHAILLGLPLFLVFRSKRWINVISSITGGFLAGAIPGGLLAWPLRPGSRSSSSINGVPTVVDGIPTTAGWVHYMELLVYLGSFGALAGLVFWLVLKLSGGLAITAGGDDHGSWRTIRWGSAIGFSVVAVLLAGAVVAVPGITKDRTCHNLFRDGGTHRGAKVNIDLQIANDEWSKLKNVIADFSVKRELSFRDSSQTRPDVVSVLTLSLCDDRGTNILVNEQRWALRDFAPPIAGRGVGITIYEVRVNSGWESIARDLVSDLEAIWPGKVQFRDGNNRIIPMPKGLHGSRPSSPGG